MLRRPTDEANPADWFEFAANRLRSADVLWQAERLTASGIELLQEAAEWYGELMRNQTGNLVALIQQSLPQFFPKT